MQGLCGPATEKSGCANLFFAFHEKMLNLAGKTNMAMIDNLMTPIAMVKEKVKAVKKTK